MIGIRIGEETSMICLNPRFILGGRWEGFTFNFGYDKYPMLKKISGSRGIGFTWNTDILKDWVWWKRLAWWITWGNSCRPRDIDYYLQSRRRKKRYGF